ncbi:integrase core domain-containing protein, partial [Arthrobacter sp.]|uniref:integrase core domain-containing protein n=1 Tax=Arthrobacter sp. TaxID=1667 RepID=UPI003A956F38
QGKNERSHQTLQRFLAADRSRTLDQLRARITRYRQHYNQRRPHQSLNQSTPPTQRGSYWPIPQPRSRWR